MKPSRRQILALVVQFVPDVVRGSWLLGAYATTGAMALHRRARQLTEKAPQSKTTREARARETSGHEKTAPAPDAKTEPEPEKGKKQKPAQGAKSKKQWRWSLDTLAGLAVGGWVAWCFARQPLAAAWHAATPHLAPFAPLLPGWWIALAWLTAQYEKHRHTPSATVEESSRPGPPDDAAARRARCWFGHLVCVQVRDAVAQGRRGIHLKALLDEPGIPSTWTVTTLREHCDRAGIPVKKMRIRGVGGGPTHGVHVDELTAALGMPLDDAITILADTLASAPAEGASGPPEEALPEAGEEALLAPPQEGQHEPLLGVPSGAAPNPTRTPSHTPLPDPAPASPGRG
ncbi:hypothetical protein ACFUEN_28995 [Streptomyces griseorubiginosus]|uniref:hypothetical protein n=1 Tax=Streptomyces griseorubiginosus TaxID=67304 RepID=UPI0036454F22